MKKGVRKNKTKIILISLFILIFAIAILIFLYSKKVAEKPKEFPMQVMDEEWRICNNSQQCTMAHIECPGFLIRNVAINVQHYSDISQRVIEECGDKKYVSERGVGMICINNKCDFGPEIGSNAQPQ
jgi:hypothetical protein